MLKSLKRYWTAFFILFFIVLLMLFGTFGVKTFADKMFKNSNIVIKPIKEEIK